MSTSPGSSDSPSAAQNTSGGGASTDNDECKGGENSPTSPRLAATATESGSTATSPSLPSSSPTGSAASSASSSSSPAEGGETSPLPSSRENEPPLLPVRHAESAPTRTKLVFLLDVLTGSVRVLSLGKVPPQDQPAFDTRLGRSLAQLTSRVVTALRTASHAPQHPAVCSRELTNDTVLTGRSLPRLVNPAMPLAIVL